MKQLTSSVRMLAASAAIIGMGCCGTAANAASHIVVTGNDIIVPLANSNCRVSNGTQFGARLTSGGSVTNSFDITNAGDTNLVLTLPIVMTGPSAGDFSVVVTPASIIPPGQHTTFAIKFDPAGGGGSHAVVNIVTNDPAFPTAAFNIRGTGLEDVPGSQDLAILFDQPIKVKCTDAGCTASGTILVVNRLEGDLIENESITLAVTQNGRADLEGTNLPLLQFDVPSSSLAKPIKFKKVKFQIPVPQTSFRIYAAIADTDLLFTEIDPRNNLTFTTHFVPGL